MGFVPMINEDALKAMDEQIDSRSPPLKPHMASPTNGKEGGMADLNEISAINNTTAQDTSQNISQLDLIRKLHSTAMHVNTAKGGAFDDTQSNASYVFNEEDLQNYEEHIQEKINEVWQENQREQEQVQNDYQQELETIIEECAQIKYEKMAEIKIMFKNCGPERGDERDKELE